MRPKKVLDQDILIGLTEVFRTKGFEGASLKELAEKIGLKKASLYHRFPNGKEEMASAVLSNAVQWGENLLHTLSNEEDPPPLRFKKGLDQVRIIYGYGKETCLFRALSMQAGLELFQEQINKGMRQWIKAFKNIGEALKLPSDVAERFAIETLIEIQGSLVVAKCFQDVEIFEKTLQKIEIRYLNA